MRGVIRNRGAAQQIRDFSGLRWGNITPTDIDMFVDFGNKSFVIAEAKYNDAKIPNGQQCALTRLADRAQGGGAEVLLVVVSHQETSADIDYATLPVFCIYYGGHWLWMGRRGTPWELRELIDTFKDFVESWREVEHLTPDQKWQTIQDLVDGRIYR